jgi:uncharacterized protein with HEPN domain
VSDERGRRYLDYILESINLVEQWAASGRDIFLNDDLVQSAILYRLETLAEAVGQLPDDVKDGHPDVPWRDITNFRNRVAHGYLALNLNRIWRVIEAELPGLKQTVEEELRRYGPNQKP